jgi:FlaA1/EpsC-like NDP-sugar epimerase
MDAALIGISFYGAFVLRFETYRPTTQMINSHDFGIKPFYIVPIMVVVGVVLVNRFGMHRMKLRAMAFRSVRPITYSAIAICFAAMLISYFLNLHVPRSVPFLAGGVFFTLAILARRTIVMVLEWLRLETGTQEPVAIYGAGSAGVQLAAALRNAAEVEPVVFLDDNPSMWGLVVAGLPVRNPNQIDEMVEKGRVKRVFLAIPSITRQRQSDILAKLGALDCELRILPSFVDLASQDSDGHTLRTVTPDELLGREMVHLDVPDVARAYAGRTIMVTGAGGSIGSELCRQLVGCGPARIILFEQSEYALYEIERDLATIAPQAGIEVVARLGSVTNGSRVAQVLAEEAVDIILHAAAYKHVPLVEDNQSEGISNNVFGTQTVAEAAEAAGIERFILVSTDKAVRPTNIMGATKRMAELIVQDLQTRNDKTKYAMVRFGNVLFSSGSVLPLFQRQIQAGGPVTVTDANVTRFFMTIPEAARLVLLAGAYAEGGDVFVLDMGKPVKILDIARRMITMSGRRVKENGVGDIEIKITQLRPGEKLYEELLLDRANLRKTPHEKIMRAEETRLSQIEVAAMLRELREAQDNTDPMVLRRILERWVEGYHQENGAARPVLGASDEDVAKPAV